MEKRLLHPLFFICGITALLAHSFTLHGAALELLQFDAELQEIIELHNASFSPKKWSPSQLSFQEASKNLSFDGADLERLRSVEALPAAQKNSTIADLLNEIQRRISLSTFLNSGRPNPRYTPAADALREWLEAEREPEEPQPAPQQPPAPPKRQPSPSPKPAPADGSDATETLIRDLTKLTSTIVYGALPPFTEWSKILTSYLTTNGHFPQSKRWIDFWGQHTGNWHSLWTDWQPWKKNLEKLDEWKKAMQDYQKTLEVLLQQAKGVNDTSSEQDIQREIQWFEEDVVTYFQGKIIELQERQKKQAEEFKKNAAKWNAALQALKLNADGNPPTADWKQLITDLYQLYRTQNELQEWAKRWKAMLPQWRALWLEWLKPLVTGIDGMSADASRTRIANLWRAQEIYSAYNRVLSSLKEVAQNEPIFKGLLTKEQTWLTHSIGDTIGKTIKTIREKLHPSAKPQPLPNPKPVPVGTPQPKPAADHSSWISELQKVDTFGQWVAKDTAGFFNSLQHFNAPDKKYAEETKKQQFARVLQDLPMTFYEQNKNTPLEGIYVKLTELFKQVAAQYQKVHGTAVTSDSDWRLFFVDIMKKVEGKEKRLISDLMLTAQDDNTPLLQRRKALNAARDIVGKGLDFSYELPASYPTPPGRSLLDSWNQEIQEIYQKLPRAINPTGWNNEVGFEDACEILGLQQEDLKKLRLLASPSSRTQQRQRTLLQTIQDAREREKESVAKRQDSQKWLDEIDLAAKALTDWVNANVQ